MLDASGEVAGEDGLFRPSSKINAMKKMLGVWGGGDAGTHLAWFLGQWDGSAVGLQIGSWDSRGGPCLLAVLVLFLFR